MTPPPAAPHRLRIRLLLLAAGLGLLARLLLALVTYGSNDVSTWDGFGRYVLAHGMRDVYETHRGFNHPPLMGYVAAALIAAARALDLGFAALIKVPALIGEALVGWLLWRIWKPAAGPVAAAGAVAAFAWNLDSILLSGFHGNTDPLCAGLSLLAAYLLEVQRPFSAGLALAASLNVKLIPLLLLPPLALSCRTRSGLLRFAGGVAIGLLPFLPVVLFSWPSFHRNAIAYTSKLEHWGILAFLLPYPFKRGQPDPMLGPPLRALSSLYVAAGRWVVLGLVAVLSVVARRSGRWDRYVLGALTFAIFLVFTPGFGVQYTVYVVPFLFAARRGTACLYSTLAGLYLLIVYYSFWTGTDEWIASFRSGFPLPAPLFGVLAWTVLVHFLWRHARGIIHEDVTPACVPVMTEGSVTNDETG